MQGLNFFAWYILNRKGKGAEKDYILEKLRVPPKVCANRDLFYSFFSQNLIIYILIQISSNNKVDTIGS